MDHLDKVRRMTRQGEPIPSSAKRPLLDSSERESRSKRSPLLLTELIEQYVAKAKAAAERELELNSKSDGYKADIQKRMDNLNSRFKAIKTAFDGRYADSIEPHEIKDFLECLGALRRTMNRYKTTLSAIYQYAKERKLLAANPVLEVKRYPEVLGCRDGWTRLKKTESVPLSKSTSGCAARLQSGDERPSSACRRTH